MPFDLDIWKEKFAKHLPGWKDRMKQAGVNSIYAALSAAALLPVAEAYQSDPTSAILALGGVSAGIGANLLANQIQHWKDETNAAKTIAAEVEVNQQLRAALDAILEKLDVLKRAENELAEKERPWYTQTLKAELNRLGSSLVVDIQVGDGAVAYGPNAKAVGKGGVMIDGNNNVVGDYAIVNQNMPKVTKAALRTAYLNHVYESTSQLTLAGIDRKAASKAEARLNLSAVYTALLTRSVEMEERSADRSARKAIEELRDQPTRRISALEQLNRSKHLVLLGDPGSGKSTFVNFVALCLAGEALGVTPGISTLTTPLPAEEEELRAEDKEPKPQKWDHKALLPARVILRDFAARGLPPENVKATAKHLWDFIAAELHACELGDYAPLLRKHLQEQGGLLMLDGLDEVPEADRRRAQIKSAVEDFSSSFPQCRVLVTSRTYAYQKQDWRLNGYAESVLAPFSAGQIRYFIDRWYEHIARLQDSNLQNAQGSAEMLKRAIFHSERLRELAERPLLLTLMASLHAWRGGTLPEKREELYAETVDLLMDRWESQRVVRDGSGKVILMQPSLVEWLKVDREKVRYLLNELAFQAHSEQTEQTETADIPEERLIAGLMRIKQNPDISSDQLVEFLTARAGLLLPRGVGVYTFPHRTIQEYLAACYLTDQGYPELAAELACHAPGRWREAALLAGAKAARGGAFALWPLVDALCASEPKGASGSAEQWGALLAGQAILENADLTQVSAANQRKLERVRGWQLQLMNMPEFPALERARAGDALARLGDPRFDPQYWYLPDEPLLGFVQIPEGPFWMGSDPQKDQYADDDEQPGGEISLPTFYMGRYPVTVAQWREFVDRSGHTPEDPDSLRDLSNRPVRWVSWHEALAYCGWLETRLREISRSQSKKGANADAFWQGLDSGELRVTLPSEAEWEKAARGTDGRIYPWGDAWEEGRCNSGESGIGDTSAVGCFSDGASPYELQDMSGNVWEWTRSLWGEDWEKPKFKYPYNTRDGREKLDAPDKILRVLRGGSFNYYETSVRCAYRFRGFPDLRFRNFGFRVAVFPLSLNSGRSGTLGL